jgi:hypothetical protein
MAQGIRDAGVFLARSVSAGVVGGLASAAWAALYAGLRGLPLWSPLALYETHFLGFSPQGVVTRHLVTAVIAGAVWQVMLGMAAGALFALAAGALLDPRALARSGWLIGTGYGLLIGLVVEASRVRVESLALSRDLPAWAVTVGFALIGLTVGALAGGGAGAARG